MSPHFLTEGVLSASLRLLGFGVKGHGLLEDVDAACWISKGLGPSLGNTQLTTHRLARHELSHHRVLITTGARRLMPQVMS